jgi:pimeloyl-ACP methyl ester carboxylesterase
MTLESIEQPRLHGRFAGVGPLVVCLHASAGSSSQWEPLIEAGAERYRFAAFDLHGHGRSAAAPEAPYRLALETEAVLRAIAHADRPLHLVGHSYGGAVAIDIASRLGAAVASVTLYEPVLFGLLDDGTPEHQEITAVGRAIMAAAATGQLAEAACTFIDYWSSPGSFNALPPGGQQRIAARMAVVASHFHALFSSAVPLARLQSLRAPMLLLHGDSSPAPALAVARRLAGLAGIESGCITGAGHMGPITHTRDVVPRILAHLDAHRGVTGALPMAA